jgi:flagellar protein FliO/FliZ
MIPLLPRIALVLLLLVPPLPLMASAAPQNTAAELPAHAPAPAAQPDSADPRRPGEITTGRPPASARPASETAQPAPNEAPIAPLPGDNPATTPTVSPDTAAAPATTTPPAPTVTPAPARAQVTMPTTTGPGAGGLLQTIFALLLVLGLLAGLAWFMKRYGPKAMGSSANLRVVGALNIGGRERIMVVEVGDQWIVVGAAPGRVNALHTMPRQEGEAAIAPAAGGTPAASFSDWLKKTIDNRGDKRSIKRNAN